MSYLNRFLIQHGFLVKVIVYNKSGLQAVQLLPPPLEIVEKYKVNGNYFSAGVCNGFENFKQNVVQTIEFRYWGYANMIDELIKVGVVNFMSKEDEQYCFNYFNHIDVSPCLQTISIQIRNELII